MVLNLYEKENLALKLHAATPNTNCRMIFSGFGKKMQIW